ncbi:hypothetical protein RF11_03688 [Thelohanellus kitauei]|uniref:Uncharacterized protein n=1 Tax=Thelohanellus kitauei TaxID=669202 RepID=A0A0C2JQ06_THEKT|nr:hypothetical protein RF11_03688 [Thelohanellus kitauei]
MSELSKDTQPSDRQCSTFDQNIIDEDHLRLANTEPSDPNVQNNEVTYKNISLLNGITSTPRKHQKHRVYIVFEDDKYHIFLFRRNLSYDLSNNATEVTCDQSYTFIKEQVEFDEQLFTKSIYTKRRRPPSPKFGEKPYVKCYRCIVDGCNRKFHIKERLQV